jgi:hypothetical protein
MRVFRGFRNDGLAPGRTVFDQSSRSPPTRDGRSSPLLRCQDQPVHITIVDRRGTAACDAISDISILRSASRRRRRSLAARRTLLCAVFFLHARQQVVDDLIPTTCVLYELLVVIMELCRVRPLAPLRHDAQRKRLDNETNRAVILQQLRLIGLAAEAWPTAAKLRTVAQWRLRIVADRPAHT